MEEIETRVLYIEDNPVNAKLIERIVGRLSGITLTIQGDGTSGLASARHQRPHLILLDLHLPDVTGEAVLGELRRDPALASTCIVFLTADAAPATAARLAALGADGILTKPVQVQDVIDLIESARPEAA